jgi:putative transcriptional regulator
MDNKIAELRSKKGLTQTKLASMAGITRPYLSEIERGLKTPGADIAKRICEALAEPFEEVFCSPAVNYNAQDKLTGTDTEEYTLHFTANRRGPARYGTAKRSHLPGRVRARDAANGSCPAGSPGLLPTRETLAARPERSENLTETGHIQG